MVQPRNRPTPDEWSAIKPEFEKLYSEENRPLRVAKAYFESRGFIATDRQYKTKVRLWDLDNKKIKGPLWQSMNAVMIHRESLGLTSVFFVPIRGTDVDVVRPNRIIKQLRRDKTVFDKKNYRRAMEILQEARIRVEEDVPLEKSKCKDPNGQAHGFPAQESHSGPQQHDQLGGDNYWGSGGGVAGPSRSAPNVGMTGTQRHIQQPFAQAGHRELTTSAHIKNHTWASLAFGSQLPSTGPAHGPVTPSAFLAEAGFDIPAIIGSPIPDSSKSHQMSPRLLGQVQGNDVPMTAMRYEQQLAAEWASPYLLCYMNDTSLTPSLRDGGKKAFQSMLENNNCHIFPYCNWMVTVLACNNQPVLLTQFLQDCCEVIDTHPKGYALTYGTPFHICLALHTENEHNVESYKARLMTSINTIKMLWGLDSPNNLVCQYYLAWLLLEQKEYVKAIDILRECLPLAEKMMGARHVVTLNCLTILARGLAATGREHDAIDTLRDFAYRLQDCVNPLQAYRDRQIMRLIELEIQTGDLVQAENNLRSVIFFRTNHFGFDSPVTWKAIEALVDVLKTQGRLGESSHLLQQCTNHFYTEIEQAWLDRYKVTAPWSDQRSPEGNTTLCFRTQ